MNNRIKKEAHPLMRFVYAFYGIVHGYQTERNFRFHVFAAIVVMLLAFFFQITRVEWILIIFAIGMVMCAELLNSAIERVVDLVTEDYHELAKAAKDLAAGAVLLISITAALIGICIFVPYIVQWVSI